PSQDAQSVLRNRGRAWFLHHCVYYLIKVVKVPPVTPIADNEPSNRGLCFLDVEVSAQNSRLLFYSYDGCEIQSCLRLLSHICLQGKLSFCIWYPAVMPAESHLTAHSRHRRLGNRFSWLT